METKKNPRYDVYRQKNKFFFLGLSISTCLCLTAFEWTTLKVDSIPSEPDPLTEGEILFTAIEINQTKQEVVPQVKSKSTLLVITEPVDNVPVISFEPEEKPVSKGVPITLDSLPSEETPTYEVYPEVFPVPIGGYEKFYMQLSKTLRYPKQAIRSGIQGKVFVEFMVDPSGAVSQSKVIKGVGGGCDEEAVRVINQTQWEPGRQRGKPVSVRMVVPIYFRLN